ncbi:hypothetical protein G7046_g8922 [Stylonectria norvegica]|nr:hypothetical protein G7046_g8922 [Stylonectria norvegica]
MQRSLRRIRHSPATTRIPSNAVFCAASLPSTRPRLSTALTVPSTAPSCFHHRLLWSQAISSTATQKPWGGATYKTTKPSSRHTAWSKDGKPGPSSTTTQKPWSGANPKIAKPSSKLASWNKDPSWDNVGEPQLPSTATRNPWSGATTWMEKKASKRFRRWSIHKNLREPRTQEKMAFNIRPQEPWRTNWLDDVEKKKLQMTLVEPGPEEIKSWERLMVTMRRRHGDVGEWEIFLEMRRRGRLHILREPDAGLIREHILSAALKHVARSKLLLLVSLPQIRHGQGFVWPDLYTKVVHYHLSKADYQSAFLWHLRLFTTHPPSTHVFGALLSTFVVDPEPMLQSTLTTMYLFSTHRKMYDHLIPTLFDAGRSKLARSWRKKLLQFQDFPLTTRSRAFIQFIARYYLKLPLAKEELDLLSLEDPDEIVARKLRYGEQPLQPTEQPKGIYSDSFTAQLFASSWTSTDFAIKLVHRFGVRAIGPRSLQSLALREGNAKGVADRINQLEKLGIAITPKMYSRALVFFAKNRNDKLLTELVHCDIHPDEFDNAKTRQVLRAAARQQDWKQERLFQGIEWAIQDETSPRHLNSLLRTALMKRDGIGKARLVLDRMESCNVTMEQKNANALLKRLYEDLRMFPLKSKQRLFGLKSDPHLDRAINITRRLVRHDIAIPQKYWTMLLYNLGRLGRYNELEQLCMEIVSLYNPSAGGMISVYYTDMPNEPDSRQEHQLPVKGAKVDTKSNETKLLTTPHSSPKHEATLRSSRYSEAFLKAEMGDRYEIDTSPPPPEGNTLPLPDPKSTSYSEAFWKAEMGERYKDPNTRRRSTKSQDGEKTGTKYPKALSHYIPADLPFSHRDHPVQMIFGPRLQRSIVRWGFDQLLAHQPSRTSLLRTPSSGIASFDLACGVRLLAKLRDQGVLIDQQLLRTTLFSRMALAVVPGRRRSRARDLEELSPASMKRMIEEAWGSELLPDVPGIMKELEDQKPKLWSRYPVLFDTAYDRNDDHDEWAAKRL